MKFTVAAATAIALAIAATTASAGVVISQNASRKTPKGDIKTERTIMVQGNKQKIINGEQVTIIDLDAGKMSIMRPSRKLYGEGPFPPVGMFAVLMSREGLTVGFKKAATPPHKRDKYVCQDYNGSVTFSHANIGVIECVASSAPGAKEYVAFQRAMAQKLKGTPLEETGEVPDGIPVNSITAVTQIAFSPTGGVAPEMIAKLQADMDKHPTTTFMNVSKIEVKDIAAAEFIVPADFKKQEMPALRVKVPPGAAVAPSPAAH